MKDNLLCLWKLVLDEYKQQTRFAACTVAENQHFASKRPPPRQCLFATNKSTQPHDAISLSGSFKSPVKVDALLRVAVE